MSHCPKDVAYLRWASCRARKHMLVAITLLGQGDILTVQDTRLTRPVLASNLKTAAIDEVENNAVGQLLNLDIRYVRLAELAHVVALGALGGTAALSRESAEDEVALGVKA